LDFSAGTTVSGYFNCTPSRTAYGMKFTGPHPFEPLLNLSAAKTRVAQETIIAIRRVNGKDNNSMNGKNGASLGCKEI